MSVDHLKKQAKNAQRLLPHFVLQHPSPYTLAQCQELVAGLSGYPSWHAAIENAKAQPVASDDPCAAFYCYDWRKASPSALPGLDEGAALKRKISLHQCGPADALQIIQGRLDANPTPEHCLFVVNAAGEPGGAVLDQLVDEPEYRREVATTSCGTLSNRGGLTFNPLAGMKPLEIAEWFASVVSAVATIDHTECSREALSLLLSASASYEFDLPYVQHRIDQLIRLSQGGWTKEDEDFYTVFETEEFDDDAHEFLDKYENVSDLLRPLDALLTRLCAPGLDLAFSPAKVGESDERRELLIQPGEFLSELQLVHLQLGSEILDHVAGLLVICHVLHSSSHESMLGVADGLPEVTIVLIRPN